MLNEQVMRARLAEVERRAAFNYQLPSPRRRAKPQRHLSSHLYFRRSSVAHKPGVSAG